MSPIFVFLRDVWIRTQSDAGANRHASNLNLATYLPKKNLATYLPQLSQSVRKLSRVAFWGVIRALQSNINIYFYSTLARLYCQSFPWFSIRSIHGLLHVKDAPWAIKTIYNSSSAGCDIAKIISFSFSFASSFCSRKDGSCVSRFTSHQWDKKNAAAVYG